MEPFTDGLMRVVFPHPSLATSISSLLLKRLPRDGLMTILSQWVGGAHWGCVFLARLSEPLISVNEILYLEHHFGSNAYYVHMYVEKVQLRTVHAL